VREQAWGIKTAKIRATTSRVLTLYFCNVMHRTWNRRDRSTNRKDFEKEIGQSGAARYRQAPKESRFVSRFKQLSQWRASGQWRRGSAFANAMISASLPRIRRRRCIQSHAPGSCEAVLRAGCLSLHLANACW